MEKHLTLFANSGRFVLDESFTKVENDDLKIIIDTKFAYNVELYAVIDNGEKVKTLLIKNKTFIIDNDFIKIGQLKMKIVAKLGGLVVGEYICTPIIIKELEGKVAIIDEIVDFENKLKEFDKKIDLINEKVDKITQLVKGMIIIE